jgi:hypothetical protein
MNIKKAVAEKIASSNDAVAARVIDAMAEATLAKRVKTITDAYIEVDNLNKDLRRAKPDMVTYAEDGAVASSLYSKAALEARNKIIARISKVSKAIDKALSGDFTDINNIGDNKKATAPSDESE